MAKSHKKIRLIPVILDDDTPARIDTDSLEGWAPHHGKTAKDVKVDSLDSKSVGKSILLRKGENGPVFSTSKDDFEVAAVQILKGMGYKVTYPASDS